MTLSLFFTQSRKGSEGRRGKLDGRAKGRDLSKKSKIVPRGGGGGVGSMEMKARGAETGDALAIKLQSRMREKAGN